MALIALLKEATHVRQLARTATNSENSAWVKHLDYTQDARGLASHAKELLSRMVPVVVKQHPYTRVLLDPVAIQKEFNIPPNLTISALGTAFRVLF